MSVTTEGHVASFQFVIARWEAALGSITATATRSAAPFNTSEFSAPLSPAPPGVPFRRGDPNADGATDISDPLLVLLHVYLGEPAELDCPSSADMSPLRETAGHERKNTDGAAV